MKEKNILLFDGVCNLCNGTVNWLIDHDPEGKLYFCSLQSEKGQAILEQFGLEKKDFQSVIFLKNNTLYQKSDAALEVLKTLGGFWKILYFFKIVPLPIRNYFYDLIARNRYTWFGKSEACRILSPELKKRFIE